MITVKCTREGLIGQRTASGYVIDTVVPYVALPTHKALGQFIVLTTHLPTEVHTARRTYAVVLDVGPWNVKDDLYVFQAATTPGSGDILGPGGSIRPQSEGNVDVSANGKTNGAGIDLGEAVWKALGLPPSGGSATVSWEFL